MENYVRNQASKRHQSFAVLLALILFLSALALMTSERMAQASAVTIVPTKPTNVIAANVTANRLNLSWKASTDLVGVKGYEVYRDATLLATVNAISYSVNGLTPGTTYVFTVRAVNAANNKSDASAPLTVKTKGAPTNITLSSSAIAENRPGDSVVGLLSATDPDTGDKFTYRLVSGEGDSDNLTFNIMNNSLRTTRMLNYENQTSYAIRLAVTDSFGLSFEKMLTISVTNVNDVPTIFGPETLKFAQNAVGTVSGITVTDEDSPNLTVKINAGSGQLSLTDATDVTVTGANTKSLVVSGAIAKLNSALATLSYTNTATFAGQDTLTITVNDGGKDQPYRVKDPNKFYAPFNMHYYEFVSAPMIPWTDARIEALKRTAYGLKGYLMTITSKEENDFVVNTLLNNKAGWIGLTDQETEGTFKWMDGPEAGGLPTFTNWNTNEPNNVRYTPDGEDYAQFIGDGKGKWNDLPMKAKATTGAYTIHGYVVEYGGPRFGGEAVQPARLTVFVDSTAPTAPTALARTNVTRTGFVLSWKPSTDNVRVVGYEIYASGKFLGISTTPTFRVTGLADNQSYNMTVVAYDAAGNKSTASSPLTVVVPDFTPPSAPTGLVVSNLTDVSATLSWTASTDNIGVQGYRVLRGTTPISTSLLSALTTNLTILKAKTNYTISVIAVDQAGNSSAPAIVDITTLASSNVDTTAPVTPKGFSVSQRTATGFRLSWTESTDAGGSGLDLYEVYVNGDSEATDTVPTAEYVMSRLAPNTTYNITVVAVDKAGNKSAPSAVYSPSTVADTVAPSAPVGLKHTVTSPSSFTLTWSAATDLVGVKHYEVLRNGDSVGITTDLKMDLTGLTVNTIYSMRVVAYDEAGNGSLPSAIYRASAYSDSEAPSVPSGLAVSDRTPTSFSVTWSASVDNVEVAGYDIYLNDKKHDSTSELFYEFDALLPNTTYAVKIKAFDASKFISDFSDPLAVTTMADAIAPTAPDNLLAFQVLGSSFFLSWTAAEDDSGIAKYEVYRNGELFNDNVNGTTLLIDGLTANTTYTMTVKAIDNNGFQSELSDSIDVTTSGSDQAGPNLSIVTASVSADQFARVRYNLQDQAYLVVRIINKSNKTMVTGIDNILTKPGTRGVSLATGKIKDGKYLLQLIAKDKTSGALTIIYNALTIDHTKPDITNMTATSISELPNSGLPGANANVSFRLSETSSVTVGIYDAVDQSLVRWIHRKKLLKAGEHTFSWNGLDKRNQQLPDGRYIVRFDATDLVKLMSAQKSVSFTIERNKPVLDKLVIAPSAFKPSGATNNTVSISFVLSENANVNVKIINADATVVNRVLMDNVARNAGAVSVTWDGKNTAGAVVAPGTYKYTIFATDASGKTSDLAIGNLTVNP